MRASPVLPLPLEIETRTREPKKAKMKLPIEHRDPDFNKHENSDKTHAPTSAREWKQAEQAKQGVLPAFRVSCTPVQLGSTKEA